MLEYDRVFWFLEASQGRTTAQTLARVVENPVGRHTERVDTYIQLLLRTTHHLAPLEYQGEGVPAIKERRELGATDLRHPGMWITTTLLYT